MGERRREGGKERREEREGREGGKKGKEREEREQVREGVKKAREDYVHLAKGSLCSPIIALNPGTPSPPLSPISLETLSSRDTLASLEEITLEEGERSSG